MRADALMALRLMLTGIADQFDMLVGFIAIQGVKGVIRQRQRFSKGAQQGGADLGHGALPAEQRGFQRRQGFRPQVRPLQALPARRIVIKTQRRTLGANIKLFSPVWLPAGQLRCGAVIAAKVRGMNHRDRLFLLIRQGKKAAGLLLDSLL
jgi:hypothetical protein